MYDKYCICLAIFPIKMWVCQTTGCTNSFWGFLSWKGALDAREVYPCGKIARISSKNLGFLPTPPPRVFTVKMADPFKIETTWPAFNFEKFPWGKMLQDEAVISTNDDATSCKRYNMSEIQQKSLLCRHWCAKTFSLTFVRFSVLDRK